MSAMFEGFRLHRVALDGVDIACRIGGEGPPMLLLHGHPQTHAMWHAVAPALAQRFTIVAMDLRGRGDSSRPSSSAQLAVPHEPYTKRVMARDVMALMHSLGFERFDVCGHDRGARVAHRLGMDHPQAARRLMLLDIAPTLAMYRGTTEAFARAYWHWYFLIQPAPTPERLIDADPSAFLREGMGRRHAGLGVFASAALAEYERCIRLPGSAMAICEDYRASATTDLVHDEADVAAGRKLTMPLRVLWGEHGTVGRCFDVLRLWREVASQLTGQSLPCGHYIAEEQPEALLADMFQFFGESSP